MAGEGFKELPVICTSIPESSLLRFLVKITWWLAVQSHGKDSNPATSAGDQILKAPSRVGLSVPVAPAQSGALLHWEPSPLPQCPY